MNGEQSWQICISAAVSAAFRDHLRRRCFRSQTFSFTPPPCYRHYATDEPVVQQSLLVDREIVTFEQDMTLAELVRGLLEREFPENLTRDSP